LDRTQLLAGIAALRARQTEAAEPRASFGDAADPAQLPSTSQLLAVDRARTLLVGDDDAVRRLLSERVDEPISGDLISLVIPLLSRPGLARLAAATLQQLAVGHEGVLADALLDPGGPAAARRRLPRILSHVGTKRACEALLSGVEDPLFEVRYHCARALYRLVERRPELAPDTQRVIELVRREAELAPRDRPTSGQGDGEPSLAESGPGPEARLRHALLLLGTVFEREPLELCLKALSSGDAALHGTALEYLENVLPASLYAGLRQSLLGGISPPLARVGPGRSARKIAEELLLTVEAKRRG
jgi:hypothetical protein